MHCLKYGLTLHNVLRVRGFTVSGEAVEFGSEALDCAGLDLMSILVGSEGMLAVTTEVTVKLVYYGPGLCGKTTNLEKIYGNPKLENKGKMISMSTETDRTLFFDFMPMELGTIAGQNVRVQPVRDDHRSAAE